ncbi:MAG: M20/M25/M40 family metallo-hydrolase [Bacteroidaceae bacterium]|nr:M20/M25/M40 family metallo-hydrolase [Bacteroidaceae bacterium]
MKKMFIAAMAMVCASQMSAQTALSDELAFRIKSEAFSNSQIDELSVYMTDLLGPRLAASQGKLRSEELVVKKLSELGLSNARIERATDFDKGGWDNQKNYVAMTAPYYCSFAANPRAWSGSTNGLVKGEVMYIDALNSEADIEKYKGKCAGKIVLLPVTQTYQISFDPLASRLTDEQLAEMELDSRADVTRGGGRRNFDISAYMKMRQLQNKLTEMIKSEGALAVIRTSGTFNVTSGSGVNYKMGDPEPTPEITLPLEDGGRMARLLKRGEKVEMELDVKNVFSKNGQINNVVAEIPGTDPKLKNEVVLIGAHLDSWHGGTGGADNSSGCIVMMEALRIIKAAGINPRRTIRIALWGGEEQGLYGSRGYLENNLYTYKEDKKLPGYDNFALYLNMDNGSGRFRGIYLEQNDLAVPYFKTWGKAIESLGFKTLTLRKTGSTDHVTFDQIGLPAYQFIQDDLEYDRTYHTNMDTYERLSLDDLKIDAAMTAWLALNAANDNGRIPVKPGYPKKGTKPMY